MPHQDHRAVDSQLAALTEINTPPDKFAALNLSIDHLDELQVQIGEKLHGRAGGARIPA